MKRFTHTTKWNIELEAMAKTRGVNRCVIIEEMFAEKFDPASSAPETPEITDDKCCLTCVHEKCESGICPHDHTTREAGEEAGACAPCEPCLDHTAAKPKEEK